MNSIPKLLDVLRPTLADVAKWTGASRALAVVWQQSTFQPKPDKRRKLVAAVRKHAAKLLKLAEAVENEGEKRAAVADSRSSRGRGGRRSVPAPVRRSDSGRGAARGRGPARKDNTKRFVDWSEATLEILDPGSDDQ